jgi:hypothetical protein
MTKWIYEGVGSLAINADFHGNFGDGAVGITPVLKKNKVCDYAVTHFGEPVLPVQYGINCRDWSAPEWQSQGMYNGIYTLITKYIRWDTDGDDVVLYWGHEKRIIRWGANDGWMELQLKDVGNQQDQRHKVLSDVWWKYGVPQVDRLIMLYKDYSTLLSIMTSTRVEFAQPVYFSIHDNTHVAMWVDQSPNGARSRPEVYYAGE